MNLTDALRAGRKGVVDSRVYATEPPHIQFDGRDSVALRCASVRLFVVIDTGFRSSLRLIVRLTTSDAASFARQVHVSGLTRNGERGADMPSAVLPETFWKELERRLHRAIARARRGEPVTLLLTER